MNSKHLSAVAALAAGMTMACAHQPPPQELIEARSIYARAAAGPAGRHAPARLKLARQALEDAETSYGAAPLSEVQDRAYVAMRRAEAAEAEASAVAAAERRMAALRELATLTGVHADRARAELASAEQKANDAGQRANEAQARALAGEVRAAGAEQAAVAAEQRAQATESALGVERQARGEAEAKAKAALDQLARMAEIKQEARGLVITLSGQVLFVTDQARLLPAAQSSLDSVAATLKQVAPGSPRVVIEGHTDSTGPRDYNLDLARRRAEAVREYLIGRGVSTDLFTVAGVGPDRPVANNRTAEGRANNRRVEIIIPPSALALDKVAPASSRGGLNTARTVEETSRLPGEIRPTPLRAPQPPASPGAQPASPANAASTLPATSPTPASSVGQPPAAPMVPPPTTPPTPISGSSAPATPTPAAPAPAAPAPAAPAPR